MLAALAVMVKVQPQSKAVAAVAAPELGVPATTEVSLSLGPRPPVVAPVEMGR